MFPRRYRCAFLAALSLVVLLGLASATFATPGKSTPQNQPAATPSAAVVPILPQMVNLFPAVGDRRSFNQLEHAFRTMLSLLSNDMSRAGAPVSMTSNLPPQIQPL